MSKEKNKKNISVVTVKKDDIPEVVYKEGLGTDVEKVKLIKRIESIVRSSGEYQDYTFFLRKNMDMDSCAFFHNISKATGSKVRVEIHHSPLTLFDIASIVLERAIAEGGEINDLLLADEVAELHYNNMVGLIPLSKTLHELAHPKEGDPLVIPLYMIFGNYFEFLNKYKEYWKDNEVIKSKLDKFVEQTKQLTSESYDMLKEQFTYIKVDGFEMPVKIEDANPELVEFVKNQSAAA